MEAGGHRGAFLASEAQSNMVGLFSLLPSISDAVSIPIVATGGISDSRGISAALILGASAVQIGTGFLRSPEAGIPKEWADAIGSTSPENTITSRVFSGRLGRSVSNKYTNAATSSQAPNPAPYPIQRNLTQAMREEAVKSNNLDNMQAWAGQSAKLALKMPAKEIVIKLWNGVQTILD
jgi:nitronate monooxygenase